MKGIFQGALLGLALWALAFAGCAALPSLKGTPSTGTIQLPTSTQLLAACAAEKAAGKTGIKAPDCVAWSVMDNNCKTVSMASALTPLAGAAEVAVPALAVPGSLLNIGLSVDGALCTTQGFYAPAPVITIAPAASK
jgi:hypothetical protein